MSSSSGYGRLFALLLFLSHFRVIHCSNYPITYTITPTKYTEDTDTQSSSFEEEEVNMNNRFDLNFDQIQAPDGSYGQNGNKRCRYEVVNNFDFKSDGSYTEVTDMEMLPVNDPSANDMSKLHYHSDWTTPRSEENAIGRNSYNLRIIHLDCVASSPFQIQRTSSVGGHYHVDLDAVKLSSSPEGFACDIYEVARSLPFFSYCGLLKRPEDLHKSVHQLEYLFSEPNDLYHVLHNVIPVIIYRLYHESLASVAFIINAMKFILSACDGAAVFPFLEAVMSMSTVAPSFVAFVTDSANVRFLTPTYDGMPVRAGIGIFSVEDVFKANMALYLNPTRRPTKDLQNNPLLSFFFNLNYHRLLTTQSAATCYPLLAMHEIFIYMPLTEAAAIDIFYALFHCICLYWDKRFQLFDYYLISMLRPIPDKKITEAIISLCQYFRETQLLNVFAEKVAEIDCDGIKTVLLKGIVCAMYADDTNGLLPFDSIELTRISGGVVASVRDHGQSFTHFIPL